MRKFSLLSHSSSPSKIRFHSFTKPILTRLQQRQQDLQFSCILHQKHLDFIQSLKQLILTQEEEEEEEENVQFSLILLHLKKFDFIPSLNLQC
jgi:hypothetical protein